MEDMYQESTEVVRIAPAQSRILRITQKHVEYISLTGPQHFIDLQECAKNWVRWHNEREREFIALSGSSRADIDLWNARCVGTRGASDQPPWVQFMNDRNTRFEFRSYEAVYQELLGPLMQNGWHTFDTN
jgi:hypothetical protein